MTPFFALAILSLVISGVRPSEHHTPPEKSPQTSDALSRLEQEKVTVRAQLLDVKVKNHPDKVFAVANLRVRFTVLNNLERTLLVIPEAVRVTGIRLADSSDHAHSGPYLLDRPGVPSFKEPGLLSITDHSSPRVKAVLSGDQWEWERDFPLTLSRRSSKSSYPPEIGLEDLQKLGGFWCQFEIMFWPHNTMEEEGEHLQKEWKDHGLLLRESIASSPIRLSLKE